MRRVIYHILGRHYETSADRALRRWGRLKERAEKFFSKRDKA